MTARILSFAIILLSLLGWAAVAGPTPVRAEQPDSFIVPHVCNDTAELASVMQAEGGAQPLETRIAIMQIVKREADSRGLTVCALTRLTNFVAVRHYADAHPLSWTATQFANPRAESLELAQQVIDGALADATGGMGHWDGSEDGQRIVLRQ